MSKEIGIVCISILPPMQGYISLVDQGSIVPDLGKLMNHENACCTSGCYFLMQEQVYWYDNVVFMSRRQKCRDSILLFLIHSCGKSWASGNITFTCMWDFTFHVVILPPEYERVLLSGKYDCIRLSLLTPSMIG